ncbi:MAG: TonB-dependent receptor [Candidatus Eisenbacteria bacterium]|nr:TonB-dependent receptor [Candidatus Eisenbacteria bacterium]
MKRSFLSWAWICLALVLASWLGPAWLGPVAPAWAQEATTGSIVGAVVDPEGLPLPGATVTLTSEQGARTEKTDAQGEFRFLYLVPGLYDLTASLPGYITAESQDIEVRLLARISIEAMLTPGASETIEVVGAAPILDLSSSTTGASVSSALMSRVPIDRTFAGALAMAPAVVDGGIDRSNPSIAGSSGLENTYMVNGMSIGNTGYGSAGSYSIVYGSLGTGVNYDYLEEVQVKTGGFEPEYGEALGGFVNMVTKSGTNEFQGSVFTYQQYKELEPERQTLEDWLVSSQPDGYSSYDIGFEAGGPIVKDKAFWFAAFDPTFTTVSRRTANLVAQAEGFDHTLERKRTIYNYAANLKWNVNPKHTLSLSAFGDPSIGENGPHRAEAVAVADPRTKYSELSFGGHNVVGHWNGQISPSWFFEGTVAYHQDTFEEDPALDEPQGLDYRGDVPKRYGGVGFFEDNTSTNAQYQLKFSNFLEAAGEHHIRYGVNYQDIGYDATTNYTGRPGVPIDLGDGQTVTSSSGYVWIINPGSSVLEAWGLRSGDLAAETEAHYTAAFLSDTWSPSAHLSIMAGLRYEQEKLMGNASSFTWKNNWSPRLHLTVDPLKDNRTKLFAAYGRYFGKVPNDLAVRAMSREISYVVLYDLALLDNYDPESGEAPDLRPEAQVEDGVSVFGSEPTRIDPDSKLSYVDEIVVGAEREVIPFVSVGLSYMHRELGRTLEDVQLQPYSAILNGETDFGEYVITNPGPLLFPQPQRDYDAVTLKVEKRFHDDWQLLASYTWSRLWGNYEGYFRRDNGQSDPFITSAFDFPYGLDPEVWGHNSENGHLPNHRPHVFGTYGSHRLPNGLDIGLSVKIQSGTPVTKLGYNSVYQMESEILLEPRGESGTTPTTTDVGLHLEYPIRLPGNAFGLGIEAVEVGFDVFNLLNQQKKVSVDDLFEVGGSVQGEPYDAAPCPECANPDFGKAWAFQAPRQFVFALKARF